MFSINLIIFFPIFFFLILNMAGTPLAQISISIPEKKLPLIHQGTEEITVGYEEYFASNLSASSSLQHPDSSINSSFYLCPICQMIARNPIEVPCCRHWYCASCFLTYIEQSAARNYSPFVIGSFKCAICRGIFNSKNTRNCPCLHRAIQYNNLQVLCPFNCGLHGKLKEIAAHEDIQCPNRPIHCPFPGCSMKGPARLIYGHFSECMFRSMNCPNCGLPVKLVDFFKHNCVAALKNVIFDCKRQLEGAGKRLKPQYRLGPPGDLTLLDRSEYDSQFAIEKYCHTFNKRPSKRPGDLLNISCDTPRPHLWKRFRSRFSFRPHGPTHPPSIEPNREENQPTQNAVTLERQMAINENSSRNDSSTDSFESATPDNWSITGTDGSVVDYQEETDDFQFQ